MAYLKETPDERKNRIYSAYRDMREVMTQNYRELNDRALKDFLDDSQKRANGYVTSRDAQGKEEWQSNIFNQFTRNKVKAHIASVAKDVPRVSITATDDGNSVSFMRAEVMSHLVRSSYTQKGANPEKVILDDAWNCAINGAVIKYDGYLKKTAKQQEILSFDPLTGEIDLGDEEEVVVEDKPIEVNVPLQDLYVRNAYIADIQLQPDILWFSLYPDKDTFLAEWGKYKGAEDVPAASILERSDVETFFGEKRSDRTGVKDGRIEVLRYFNKNRNEYCVFANGVELLVSPLLWGKNKKLYPFAKTVFENFANSNFFWGNSLPNILMGDQDVANSFINLMVDKTYRSLNSPMLIDVNNRDAFSLEDEYITGDTKIYVNNVDGVKPMPQQGISAADFQMLDRVARGIDLSSTDSVQQGSSGSGSTAREIVIANERADEIKGLFFIQLRDLWIQKHILRIQNILLHYSDLKKVTMLVGEKKRDIFKNQFNLDNAELSDGSKGMMQINVFGSKGELPSARDVDVEEMSARMMGKNVEIVNITSDYLDNWEYDITVESEAFKQKARALDMALATEKLQTVATAFPEIFAANKEEFFRSYMTTHNDDPEKYLQNMKQAEAAEPQGMSMQFPQQSQLGSQITSPAQSMPALTGAG